jgi:hypothetical protein
MGKYGHLMLTPDHLTDNSKLLLSELKRLSLFFDNIYIPQDVPSTSHYETALMSHEIKHLVDKKFILPYDFDHIKYNSLPVDQFFPLKEKMDQLHPQKLRQAIDTSREEGMNAIFQIADTISRIGSLKLNTYFNNQYEIFPICRSTYSFRSEEKKTDVFRLIIEKLPIPEETTSWEQIFDFRSDKETKLKYLALINWANEISKTQYSMHEIIDRFEYLYHDYIKRYERHKIISSFGKIEVLIGGALSFLTNNAPLALNTASSLVKFGIKAVSLLQDESKLPGKEIAYVYHAGKRFSDL